MLESARNWIAGELDPGAVVLDIGGWADPLERANWVIDLMPYETRGLYERNGWIEPRPEQPDRYGRENWIVRDLCDREPYPFADNSTDFVVCAHTLEDVRDPLWVCSEMNRIAKAGYIEVPSRLEEQAWGVAGPYVGWPHHRWLIDLEGDRLDFSLKLHSLHARADQQFPRDFWERLSEGGEQRQCGWLKDRYGLSWQVVPTGMEEVFADSDPQRAQRAMQAMLGMGKLDIAALRRAADGPVT